MLEALSPFPGGFTLNSHRKNFEFLEMTFEIYFLTAREISLVLHTKIIFLPTPRHRLSGF